MNDTPILDIALKSHSALEFICQGDIVQAKILIRQVSDIADGLLNSNLTNQTLAIEELTKAHKETVRFYES